LIPFSELKIDAMLVSALPNVRYLSGFTGSNGLLLVTPESTTLFTDPRYTIRASEECSCKVKTVAKGHLELAAIQTIARKGLKKIGFEASRTIYDSYRRLKEELPLGVSLKPVGPVIEKLRMIKNDKEIAQIRQSVQTNSKAFEETIQELQKGAKESEIAAMLEYKMRLFGAEKPAFETIVAAGDRSAMPHAEPSERKTGTDELLLIDMGSCQSGYMSDMTRTMVVGKPSSKIRRLYDAVLEAQLAAIDAVKPGVKAGHVDRQARKVLEAEGLGKSFVHSTGHGLGLEIHEPPRIGRKDPTRLEAGMVITIEPGAYIRGFGGVRIEDTVLVTKTGCEILTPTSKELILL